MSHCSILRYILFNLYTHIYQFCAIAVFERILSVEGLNAKRHIHGDSGLKCGLKK